MAPRTDITRIRERLESKNGPEYWRSLEEVAATPEFQEFLHHEFPRLTSVWQQPVDRRRVLKLMAASMALGGLTGCGVKQPEKIVPYVNMPEYLVPGVPQHYASTFTLNGYGRGVVVESREGRPIKVEGNPDHPASQGATDVFAQAELLSLYEPERGLGVLRNGTLGSYRSFLDAMVQRRAAWKRDSGAGLAVLAETRTSPSELRALQQWLGTLPDARRFHHDPVSRADVYRGARLAYGEAVETIYRLNEADRVLSLDADFMAPEQPGHLAYARQFMAQRNPDKGTMARLYMFESTPTITGASADHCYPVRADAIEAVTRALARELGLPVNAPADVPLPRAWLRAVANDLKANLGRAPVIAGLTQPPSVHALVHAINHRLGNVGRGVYHTEALAGPKGEDIDELVQAIDAGEIKELVILGANPVYTAPADVGFTPALEQLEFSCHWGEASETARYVDWHIPATHALEDWGDARAFDGTVSLTQPLIEPLHGGRTALEMISVLSGLPSQAPRDLLENYWRRQYGGRNFDAFWHESLRRGVIPGSEAEIRGVGLRPDWKRRLPAPSSIASQGMTLQFRPDPSAWDGRFTNNGWLQELPRPLSKLTWDNAAIVAPATAETLDVVTGDRVRLEKGEFQLEAPVWVMPGMAEEAVSLHLGYGREYFGRIADGVGVNAYRLRPRRSPWFVGGARISKVEGEHEFATTQHHHSAEGRGLYRKATLEDFLNNPDFVEEKGYKPPKDESLYPEPRPEGTPKVWPYAWGMAIDLNACIGCEACVIACQAENNIPIVGKEEVKRGHELHWLRIDRYYSGGLDRPQTMFQPVPCMHCENAPCEYVCPVEATQHSPTGLNEMVYNRCIGTRYCSQNCPYKVRRFNWFEYARKPIATPAPAYNPEVTVRPRGVMEKCTYCVQRISRARIEAETEGRRIQEAELKTACQQVCPTQAIVFGDINDKKSTVSQWKAKSRNYAMLAELNTRPRTTYLGQVTNPNPEIEGHAESSGKAKRPASERK